MNSLQNLQIDKKQMKQSVTDNVKVFIRVRPKNDKEINTGDCVSVNQNTLTMKDNEPDHRFSFDYVFGPSITQKEVYESVGRDVVEQAFNGINGTVFAYGQTSSGKTHTCIGPDYTDPIQMGILPRMIQHLFQKIQQAPPSIQFRIKLSMVEIYMERIKDLLQPGKTDLKIRQRAGKGIYIQDVTEEYVASRKQTIQFVKKGINNRAVGQTNMNDTSSRSHMAFIITIYQNNLKDASAKSGKIILVDLAGSEKVSRTGAEGKLLDEAKQINKSLSALGNVINALTDYKVSHIPYRDSKLTRLLQQSLGGNSKTHLIINVSPSDVNQSETLSSLRFGFRAKQIKNKPKINKEYTVAELLLLLEKAQKRIQQLQNVVKQLSYNPSKRKNMKRKSQIVENLLDSDNPIVQTQQSESQSEPIFNNNVNKSKLKMHFQSQCQSESDEQNMMEISKSLISNSDQKRSLSEEKQILAEQIQMLNVQKVEIIREMDILQQKYDVLSKESRSVSSKMLYLQKQNEKLLEKLIAETCNYQESELKIQQMKDKINEYEQKILNIAAIQQKQQPQISKVFGVKNSNLNSETKKMVDMVMKNKGAQSAIIEQRIKKQIQSNASKDQRLKQLQKRNKILQEEIHLFKNLQDAKEAFIKEKLKFNDIQQRLYKDLQNRIEKVLQLEQKLDEEREKTKYYEEMIKCQQSEKNRKIMVLQQHINQMSESYYVLKGQQSSWNKNNQKSEKKIEAKNKRILMLEKQNISLKEQVSNLKMQVEELEDMDREESVLDIDYNQVEEDEGYRKSNIVKVVRSSNFRAM